MKLKIFSAIFATVLMSMQVWAQSTPPAGTKYITVNIANSELTLDLAGSTDSTDVWVETSTGIFEHKTIGTDWCGSQTYTITGGVAKVYGDIEIFDCAENQVTNLDFSNNTLLTNFYCGYNQLSSLDVSALSNLTEFYCSYNQLITLNVSGLSNLTHLGFYNNQLTTLDVSDLSNLNYLNCAKNQLTTLDVSGLSNLNKLYCYDNNLTTLDVSTLSNLTILDCYQNNFNTQTIDYIYCALPQRTATDEAKLYIANKTDDANHDNILASNATNARNKNWNVWYNDGYAGSLHNSDVPTTGSYVCGSAVEDIENAQP